MSSFYSENFMYLCPSNSKTGDMKGKWSAKTLIVVIFSTLLLLGCKDKPVQSVVSQKRPAECPISTIPTDFSDLEASAKTYPLPDGFFNEFIKYANQYEGTQITIPAQLPQEWSLLYREPLPASQELWLVQSNDKDWIYLLVTAGQHVRDAVPVAVDLASTGAIIESEVWTWHRDEDESFIVTKHYEKRPDARDTTQQQRNTIAVDRYVVSESGQFQCIPQQQCEGTLYQAVIFFNMSSEKPDTWYDVESVIVPYCEENNYFFVMVSPSTADFHNVAIQDYQGNLVDSVDISQWIENEECGIILIQNGVEPRVESYSDNGKFLQMKIRNYFNSISNINF
jgi:hypothetical protein